MAHIAWKFNALISFEDALEKELNIKAYRGQNICCPFHNDKTPSMRIYGGDRGAYCFGQCGKAYSAYDILQLKNPDFSYKEMLDYIAVNYNIQPDDDFVYENNFTSKFEIEFKDRSKFIKEYIKDNKSNCIEILKKLEISLYFMLRGKPKFWNKLLDEIYKIDYKRTDEL